MGNRGLPRLTGGIAKMWREVWDEPCRLCGSPCAGAIDTLSGPEPMVRPYRPVTRTQREEALADALRGVELGSWDKRILAWMPRTFDDGTLRTIVSLFERVRQAGMNDVLLIAEAGVRQAQPDGSSR